METKDSGLQSLLDTLDTITLTDPGSGYSDYNYGAVPPITMNSISGLSTSATSISISPGATGGTYSNTVLTSNGTNGLSWNTSPYTISTGTGLYTTMAPSGQIQLKGEDADIKINDWSLKDAIGRIEERLNLLTPNAGLEKEWDDLKELGEQYRKLEQHIKDKMATWEKLKAMSPPVVD